MWGRSPGKHSGGGKERLTSDSSGGLRMRPSPSLGVCLAGVWRVEDGRGSGRAAGGDSGNHTQKEGSQALPGACKLPAPPAARTAASASRKRAGEGRLSAEGAEKGSPGPQREAIWKRELPREEGPGVGGGSLGAGRACPRSVSRTRGRPLPSSAQSRGLPPSPAAAPLLAQIPPLDPRPLSPRHCPLP